MAYAIMRCVKLKGMGSVAASLQHCFCERETMNADPERTPTNEHFGAKSADKAMGLLRSLLPEKRRKDAVLAVEYVMTASPEWWEAATKGQQHEFVTKSTQWLADKYGSQNIIAMSVHRDELSPHISAFVVPKTSDGRLSAKDFIGNKNQMSKDQTSFAEAVKHLGLHRGVEGSKATHQRVKAHYGALKEADSVKLPRLEIADMYPQTIPARNLTDKFWEVFKIPTVETPESHLKRLNDKIEVMTKQNREMAAALIWEREKRRKTEVNNEYLRSQMDRLGLDKVPWGDRDAACQYFSEFIEMIEERRRQEREKKLSRTKGYILTR